MLAIYRYNLFKYVKSPSTWVILLISCFIAGFLGGYLPYSSFNTSSSWAAKSYSQTVVSIVAGMTTFLSLFVSVFAGFKAATMFKDEVEDGTFLVTLSKPISRGSIIFGKWLALQTILIIFTFTSSIMFGIFTYIFDCGDEVIGLGDFGTTPIREKVITVTLYLWAIITLMGLIFSSIALLLSTWLSVGTTIGISIAIGVVIPVTSLLASFTKKDQYASIQSPHGPLMHSRYQRVADLVDQYNLGVNSSEIMKMLNEHDGVISDPHSLYNLGIATGEEDNFANIWPFDFDFQIHKLAEYSSEEVVPEIVKNNIMGSAQGLTSTFGAEGISNKLDTRNDLSKNNNSDYDFIFNRLRVEIPSLWKLKDAQFHYVWKVIHNLFMLSNNFVDLLTQSYDLDQKKVNSITSIFPTTTGDDFDNVATLRAIITNDHLKISNGRTILGYKADDAVSLDPNSASDDVIKSQWWVNWYKLSKEITTSVNSHVIPVGTGARVKYLTFFNAMNALFNKEHNLGNGEISLNDYNGYFFEKGQSRIRQAFDLSLNNMVQDWCTVLKSESKMKEASALKELASLMDMATRPINVLYWDIDVYNKTAATSGRLFQMMNKNGVKPLPDSDATRSMIAAQLPNYNLSDADYHTLRYILGLAKNRPDLLVKIISKGYVEKTSILLVYLFIAAALVPLSYWIVRRKDFR